MKLEEKLEDMKLTKKMPKGIFVVRSTITDEFYAAAFKRKMSAKKVRDKLNLLDKRGGWVVSKGPNHLRFI